MVGGSNPPSPTKLLYLDGKQSGKQDGKHLPLAELLEKFLQAKTDLSPRTVEFYKRELGDFASRFNKPVAHIFPLEIQEHINGLQRSPGGKDTRYRALWAFYSWLNRWGLVAQNPFPKVIERPKVKGILPHLTPAQIGLAIKEAPTSRDKAFIALLGDSGARLSEILGIRPQDIEWEARAIKVVGKGNKPRLIPFGEQTASLLRQHLERFMPGEGESIWGFNRNGVHTMLRRLENRLGFPCNPHTFRRSFAIALRDKGIDALVIKELGGWESLDMVLHYTRGYQQAQALKHYRPVVA